MADLNAAQSAAFVQRQSLDDLQTVVLILQRDGSLGGEFADPLDGIEDDDEKKAAEEARDTEIANSTLLSEVPAPGPSEEELAGNKEAAEAAGELDESAEPKAATTKKQPAAAAQGS